LITRPIEEVLDEVEGVEEITSQSLDLATSQLSLLGCTDVDARLVDANKLQQVSYRRKLVSPMQVASA